jgi:hypothetical protein
VVAGAGFTNIATAPRGMCSRPGAAVLAGCICSEFAANSHRFRRASNLSLFGLPLQEICRRQHSPFVILPGSVLLLLQRI